MKAFLLTLGFLAILGTVGHYDMQTEQMEAAANTCQAQNEYTTPTFQQCINNQIERNNDK